MYVVVACPKCRQQLKLAQASLGQAVKCPCGAVFATRPAGGTAAPAPRPEQARPAAAPTPPSVVATCAQCRQQMRVPESALGGQVKCPRCAAIFTVPAKATPVAPTTGHPKPAGTGKPPKPPASQAVKAKQPAPPPKPAPKKPSADFIPADQVWEDLPTSRPAAKPTRRPKDEDRWEERPPTLADKLHLLFEATHPDVHDASTLAVWSAGELLRFNGNFNLYVRTRDLIKQEGIIFRHLLRLILLCGEFAQVTPPDADAAEWQADLRDLAERLTASCREVDPTSTDEVIEHAHAADVVEGETAAKAEQP